MRRKKTGNYTVEERRLIMMAATSHLAGGSPGEKQSWLMSKGVHRPGVPADPVSESAIKYWAAVERRFKPLCDTQSDYELLLENLFTSPKSYRALKGLTPDDII